jgi:fructokinase
MLIDFTGGARGTLDSVNTFKKNPGGAPANVAVCAARLGGKVLFITKLGEDAFGRYLVNVLKKNGVDISAVKVTKRANTPLAFVTLDRQGERDFSFYRNPSSDLFLESGEIERDYFATGDILHFCSVDLVDFPVKDAHRTAIRYAQDAGMLISFDPNLRCALWSDANEMLTTVREFVPYCHILKMSVEELREIGGYDERAALKNLFVGSVKIIIVTDGKNGACAYFYCGERIEVKPPVVAQIDATGAGDAFVGALLVQLLSDKKTPDNLLSDKKAFERYLTFANKTAALCVTKRGAIPAMPSYADVFLC